LRGFEVGLRRVCTQGSIAGKVLTKTVQGKDYKSVIRSLRNHAEKNWKIIGTEGGKGGNCGLAKQFVKRFTMLQKKERERTCKVEVYYRGITRRRHREGWRDRTSKADRKKSPLTMTDGICGGERKKTVIRRKVQWAGRKQVNTNVNQNDSVTEGVRGGKKILYNQKTVRGGTGSNALREDRFAKRGNVDHEGSDPFTSPRENGEVLGGTCLTSITLAWTRKTERHIRTGGGSARKP